MKKSIYLHIGTHKTGTTTLQNFLFLNQDLLKKTNYDYLTDNCTWKAHHALGWSFQGAHKAIEEYCPWSKIGIINNLEYEINISDSDNFIISSENLYQLNNIDFVERFFDRFHEYEIIIIVYLRDQVSFIESWYSELIRADYYKLNEDIEKFIINPRYNLTYHLELKKWEKFTHINNILVFDFLAESKSDMLINNFCSHIGLRINNKFIIPSKKNIKINYKQLSLLKKLNSKNLAHHSWLAEREYILDNNITNNFKEPLLLNNSLKNKIRENYSISNAILKDTFNIVLEN